MHEMSLMHNVVDVVLEACEGRNVASVRTVHLTIGEAMDVVVELAEDLFRYLARDTPAANANLVINRVPFMVRCNCCCNIFPVDVDDERTRTCPRCGVYQDYRLFSGREFRVDSIEIEAGGAGQTESQGEADEGLPQPTGE